jgi:uncharacterized repeat protein (TIGR01451 family)
MVKNLINYIVILLSLLAFNATSLTAQNCAQTAGSITFAESRFDTLTTSILNRINIVNDVVVVINADAPDAGTHTLILMDSDGNILNLQNLGDSGCNEKFIFENDFFPNPLENTVYTLQMISIESLATDLAIGQTVDGLSGCFALSTPLLVNTVSYSRVVEVSIISNQVSDDHLNLFGGSIGVNSVTNSGQVFQLDICTIDTMNRTFNVFGAIGLNKRWVITDTEGILLDVSPNPFSDFRKYVDQVDLSSNSHQLEMFHVSFVGANDWLTIGDNIREDACVGPIRSTSAIYELTYVECEDTCTDGLLNGNEMFLDDCPIVEEFACSVTVEREIFCFQDSTGVLQVDVTGADDMLSFSWNTGADTQILNNVSAGSYTVTVTNSSAVNTTCNVDLDEPSELDVDIDLSFITSCSATASVTGGVRPYTYNWNNGQNFITVQNLLSHPAVTVTDANQCTDTISITPNAFSQTCGDCTDGIRNNDETGVDCGGSMCQPCGENMQNDNPIQLTKLANFIDENNDGLAQTGETIEYILTVCNTSSDTLRLITVEDPLVTLEGMAFDLAPNSCNADAFSGTYTISDADLSMGSIFNQATVSAMYQDSIMISDLSDDPDEDTNTDEGNDGEPDDPTVFILELAGPCGSPVIDTDNDGMCDALDEDDDNDGVSDAEDAFPFDVTESQDSDGDGFGDNGDFDDDNDSVDDRQDAFPLDPTESLDTDEDGIGNNEDNDDDNDMINDSEDAFPLNASESVDSDGDGFGDNEDLDDDNDGCTDDIDPNPLVAGNDCEVDPDMPPVNSSCLDQTLEEDQIAFGGEIKTEIGFPIDSVTLRVLSTENLSNPTFTDQDGTYVSEVVSTGFNYEIQPSKEDDPFPGVSTLDMLFTQRHILRIELLETPHKIIAADVSGNQELSIVDIINMRQLILGVIDEWNTGLAWNFVDADFNFFDVENPWPFADAISKRDQELSDCNADFVAIRIGDVDNSFEASNGFTAENRFIPKSDIHMVRTTQSDGHVLIDFYPTKEELLYGFQLALDGVDGNSIIESNLPEFTDDNIHIEDNTLRVSWTKPEGQNISSQEPLFSIKTKSRTSPSINSTVLNPEIYLGNSIEIHSIELSSDVLSDALSSIVATPNPFTSDVTIHFEQHKEQLVTFDLFSIDGKLLYTETYHALSGKQAIKLTSDQVSETGTFYYTLTSGSTRHSDSIVKIN